MSEPPRCAARPRSRRHGLPPRLYVVLLALALYAAGYAAFYPRGATVDDEGQYLDQTHALARDGLVRRSQKLDPAHRREPEPFVPGDYPVGMVALMAPFACGLRLARRVPRSFLCLVAGGAA